MLLRNFNYYVRKDDEIRWLFALLSDSGMRLGEAVGLLSQTLN